MDKMVLCVVKLESENCTLIIYEDGTYYSPSWGGPQGPQYYSKWYTTTDVNNRKAFYYKHPSMSDYKSDFNEEIDCIIIDEIEAAMFLKNLLSGEDDVQIFKKA